MSTDYPTQGDTPDSSLTADEREKAFPIHIEMGDSTANFTVPKVPGIDQLPDSGCALVEFKRSDDDNGDIVLMISTICLPKSQDDAEEADEPRDLEDALMKGGPKPRPPMDDEMTEGE